MSDNDLIDISSNKEKKTLQLGITKISDLLINKKITNIYSVSDSNDNKSSINNDEVVLSIPDYQRPYKWTEKNVNQLFDDIEDAYSHNKEVYRVGTLILHEDIKSGAPKAGSDGNNQIFYNIVDGQQRLLTFSLLLCLLGIDSSNIIFEKTQENNEYTLFNLQNNFLALKRRISKYSDEVKNKLLNYIKDKCELIVVITSDLSEAFQFFDSQNTRGKKLYPHDLLKAYHLREMNNLEEMVIEKVVKEWEDLEQNKLADLFNEYLYRLKEWLRGKSSSSLDKDNNIALFKGIRSKDSYPYAVFNKAANAYIHEMNSSPFSFVYGIRKTNPFLLTEPVIAGKPFFEYTQHYFSILNNKYEWYNVNNNEIVRTLNKYFNYGTGNLIVRKMFDIALLLYIDRFCPLNPSDSDLELFDHFIVDAFIWAYSFRAQYGAIRWSYAENYISGNGVKNSFNIFIEISESSSPKELLNTLSSKLLPLEINEDNSDIKFSQVNPKNDIKFSPANTKNNHCINLGKPIIPKSLLADENEVMNFLFYFDKYNFLMNSSENK